MTDKQKLARATKIQNKAYSDGVKMATEHVLSTTPSQWKKDFNDRYEGGEIIFDDPFSHPIEIKNDLISFIHQTLQQERQRWIAELTNFLMSKQEFVTYKKDNGHGVAVPCMWIHDLPETINSIINGEKE